MACYVPHGVDVDRRRVVIGHADKVAGLAGLRATVAAASETGQFIQGGQKAGGPRGGGYPLKKVQLWHEKWYSPYTSHTMVGVKAPWGRQQSISERSCDVRVLCACVRTDDRNDEEHGRHASNRRAEPLLLVFDSTSKLRNKRKNNGV